MKHWLALSVIVALGVTAMVVSEIRKVDVPPGPAAVLFLVADTEKELMRMPVRFTRMSDTEEIAIGDVLAKSYQSQHEEEKLASVQTVDKYLAQLGSRLAAHANRKLPYKFHYIPEKYFVNAFALPGGHVYVGQGLLALMDSEDELASVLGHEVEHIDHYHCAERMQVEQALRKLPFGELAALPIELFQAGYSKDQELEADREGTRMAVASGYSASGAIRMFEAFQRMQELVRRKANNPGEEAGDVANQTLEGYFRSHPLPSERIAQIQKMIASERWPVVAERDLPVAYIFWSNRAQELFAANKYTEAEAAALRSLKLQPDRQDALETLAKAYFSQAKFAESAETYRKILQIDGETKFAKDYAIALAADDKKSAVHQFDQWLETQSGDVTDLRATQAGLDLLAGNAGATNPMVREINRAEPDQLGELGWWYYLAGDYTQALKLLQEALQQRPGNMDWRTDLAWAQLQNKKFEDVLQSLNEGYLAGNAGPDRKMAGAVAFWLSEQKDASLRDFAIAVEAQPEWKNPKWVRALYSPLVADTVPQIAAEQERLRKLQFQRIAQP
ncbi:MAG TPA: M48 family metalloprotease [Terriglobales bacterium]|nr:M48 family metalloprotease [Terriglobales bacterium]